MHDLIELQRWLYGGVGAGLKSASENVSNLPALLAAADAQIFGASARTAADVLAGAFALMAFQTFASIPITLFRRRFGKPKPKGHDILEKMYHAYYEIPEHPPLSPQRIRELLQDAARIGAVWPAGLYDLLDDIQSRVGRTAPSITVNDVGVG